MHSADHWFQELENRLHEAQQNENIDFVIVGTIRVCWKKQSSIEYIDERIGYIPNLSFLVPLPYSCVPLYIIIGQEVGGMLQENLLDHTLNQGEASPVAEVASCYSTYGQSERDLSYALGERDVLTGIRRINYPYM